MKRMMTWCSILGAFACAAAVALAASAEAQDYPKRPVTLVVPFAPGGATDVVARVLGQKLGDRLGQQFLIENRAGANGGAGSAAVAKSKPDGYTLVMGGVNTHAMNDVLMKKPLYDSVKDFAPISLTARIPIAIVVHPSLGVKTLAELVAKAKAEPGALTYGSSGLGGPQQLAMEMFKTAAGIDIAHIAYRGGAPQLADLLAGHIKIGSIGLPPALQYIQSGELIALAAVEAERSKMLPNLPTVAESGYPGTAMTYWMGLLAPAGTPEPIIKTLHMHVAAILTEADIGAEFIKLGAEVATSTPAEFAALITSEIPRWKSVVEKSGISIQP